MSIEIEDCGEIKSFQQMPTEATMYLSAVCYGNNMWAPGPGGTDKEAFFRSLHGWIGGTKARIYTVKVPLDSKPAG